MPICSCRAISCRPVRRAAGFEAITQYSSLGAGFQIAMRDLEIRGAGSILGVAQSGHVTAIGFDLYCQLLEQAVAKLKGKALPRRPEVSLQLDFVERDETPATAGSKAKTGKSAPILRAYLPVEYISDTRLRIEAFRRLAGVCTPEQLKQLRTEWRDRYGRIPPAADHLLTLTGLKLLAAEKGGVHSGNQGRSAHPDAVGRTHPAGGPLPPLDFTRCGFKGSGDCRPPPQTVTRADGTVETFPILV